MTLQNPATIEERLNGALQEISQLQAVVSELEANSRQQKELLTELLQTLGGSAADYQTAQTMQAKEEGQTDVLFLEQREQKKQLNRELTELFSQFDEVQGFAVGEYLDEIRVYVSLQMEMYNGSLIERLMAAEAELEDNFPALSLIIRHIPVGDIDVVSYLGDRGNLIWKRD